MSTQTQTAQAPACDSAQGAAAAYAVGRGRPPAHSRFQKGVSGNPAGRPRRVGYAGRRSLPPIPGLERAVARTIETAYPGEEYRQVSLVEMVINELTRLLAVRHSVSAARELRYWIAEAACAQADREADEAEAAEEQARAEAAAREDEERRAAEHAAFVEEEAQARLRALAVEAHADDCDGDCGGECEDEWDGTRLLDRALIRLGAGAEDRDGEVRLEPWVVEAALARAPEPGLSEAERAVLALVMAGNDDDLGARLAGIESATPPS